MRSPSQKGGGGVGCRYLWCVQELKQAGEGHFTSLGGAECCVICAKIGSAASASIYCTSVLRSHGHMHAVHKLMSMQAPLLHRCSSLRSDPRFRNTPLQPEWNLLRSKAVKHNDSEPAVFCAQASEAPLLLNNALLSVLLVPEKSGGGGVWSGVWRGFEGSNGPSNVSRGLFFFFWMRQFVRQHLLIKA